MRACSEPLGRIDAPAPFCAVLSRQESPERHVDEARVAVAGLAVGEG
jgi:hypothetical protein